MTDAARVLDEIAANPDDDGPRLVWADLVGGERGELVVLQCDLARGDLSPAEARARRIRERALLEQHAVAWAGDLRRVAKRWSFHRGFVEAVWIPGWTSIDAWPLVRSATVDYWIPGTYAGLDRLRALGIARMPNAGVALPVLPQLRAFGVGGANAGDVSNVVRAIAGAPIETLRLWSHHMRPVDIEAVLAAAPRLVALELEAASFNTVGIEAAVARPLRALRLGTVRTSTLRDLDRSAAAATLEHLGFALHGEPMDLASILSSLARLRTIEIGGNVEAAARAVIDASLPALRVVRIRGDVSPEAMRALDERYGAQLELLETTHLGEELLHESPSELLARGPAWCEWSQPAVLARIDRAELVEIPVVSANDPIVVGRSSQVPISLRSGTVARHHAKLVWRDGAHVIEDLQSTNGIVVGNERVTRHVLRDGDELVLGAVIVRYFIGDGARARAVAALSEPSTR